MKHYLLTGLTAATAIVVAAADITPQLPYLEKAAAEVTVRTVKSSKGNGVKRLAPGVTLSASHGIKRLNSVRSLNSVSSTVKSNAMRKTNSTSDGMPLFESFEGWNGEDLEWTPDGWTVDMRGNVPRAESWNVTVPSAWLPAPVDGNYSYGINFSAGQQDEWLISPEVEVGENMLLSFWAYINPMFLYNLDNVDWNAYEFTGDREVAATLQIWAQADGGEWTMLHDYAEEYENLTLADLVMLTPQNLEKKTVSLADFSGKKVKVAFRYVGTDGDSIIIDAVGIGYPVLEDVSYMDPFSTLYWGLERGWQLTGLQGDLAAYPVYAPLTWQNMSYIEGASFSWEYCDPATSEMVTTDQDPDMLTLTYEPDYTSDFTKKNNFFYPPVLHASAPNASQASYASPYLYFQAGGKPERTLNDGSEFEASLIPFGFNNLGISMVMLDDEQIGDPAIPVFGHNANTDQYWLNYSLNGSEQMEGDYSRLEGIGNIFFATEAPLVVNGLTVHGWGLIDADAELTAVIYGLDEEMSSDFTTFTEIASATIKGSDVMAEYSDATGYLALPFNFDSPVVVQATAEHPAFVFMLKGFNSEKVKYFVPLQSATPDPNYLCFGYILNHIDLSNHIADRPAYYSFKPMVYKVGDEYVDPYASFLIGIDGEYPWLTADCEEIVIDPQGTEVKVALGSYYDGSRLSVEVPAGVEASVEGRYDKCVLTVWHNDAEVVAEGNVVVKGPGVEVSIPVREDSGNAVTSVASGKTVVGIYDLSGRCVSKADNGVFIVKYSDGSVRKTVCK